MEHGNRDLLSQTAQIVSSHLANNAVPPDTISGLIREVYSTLTKLSVGGIPGEHEPIHHQQATTLNPAVPIRRSVFPDHIVCLEDGKKLKMLKRHLMTSFNLTPEQYRERWGLSHDYPMVAPNYAQHRSSLAKKIGLGHHRLSGPRQIEEEVQDETEQHQEPRRSSSPEHHHQQQPSVRRIPEGVSGKRVPGRGRGRPRKVAA